MDYKTLKQLKCPQIMEKLKIFVKKFFSGFFSITVVILLASLPEVNISIKSLFIAGCVSVFFSLIFTFAKSDNN